MTLTASKLSLKGYTCTLNIAGQFGTCSFPQLSAIAGEPSDALRYFPRVVNNEK